MNEILKKRIEEAAKRYNARAYSPFSDPYELSREFERDCYCFKEGATFALQNQWISVDEALPEKNTMCFVRKETEIGIIYDADYIDYEGKWFFNSNRTSIKSMVITHWMHIPSLKGGEE